MRKTFVIKSPESQLAEELCRRITTGEWGARFPGIRKIMADFGVTRTVTEGALRELEAGGYLIRGGARSSSRPVRKAVKTGSRGTLIFFEEPLFQRGGEHRELILGVRESLSGEVELLSLPGPERSDAELVKAALATGFDRVLVADFRSTVADLLVDEGKSVVSMGSVGAPVKATSVYVSHAALVRGAFRACFAMGHRRVCFPLWKKRPETIAAIRSWVAEEYALAGHRHAVDFDTPPVDGTEPAALHECLRKLLRHTPPTAIIVADLSQWLAVFSVLAEMRLTVPRDVSLVCLSANTELESVTPVPTHFRYPIAKQVRSIVAALNDADRGLPPRRIEHAPIWVPGASLAAPARG